MQFPKTISAINVVGYASKINNGNWLKKKFHQHYVLPLTHNHKNMNIFRNTHKIVMLIAKVTIMPTLYDPLLILIKSCCLPLNAEDSVFSSPTCYASGSFRCSCMIV